MLKVKILKYLGAYHEIISKYLFFGGFRKSFWRHLKQVITLRESEIRKAAYNRIIEKTTYDKC